MAFHEKDKDGQVLGTLHSCMYPPGAASAPLVTLRVLLEGGHFWGRGRPFLEVSGQGAVMPHLNQLMPHVLCVRRHMGCESLFLCVLLHWTTYLLS